MAGCTSQGSWFSSGFHGHFRSKIRNDFANDYRMQAKPSPPIKFSRRLSERPTTHHFSKHDNRFSFLNTVTSFQDGLGKKKVSNVKAKGAYQPDFIAWVPHARDLKNEGPLISSYRVDFNSGIPSRAPQILINSVRRPNTAKPVDPRPPIDDRPVTTYRFVHRHLQPNPKVNTNMNTGEVEDAPVPYFKTHQYINAKIPPVYDKSSSLTGLRRSRAASAPLIRDSVAMCLQWYIPRSETVTALTLIGRENHQAAAATGPTEINTSHPFSLPASTYDFVPSPPVLTQTAPAVMQPETMSETEMVPLPPVHIPAPLSFTDSSPVLDAPPAHSSEPMMPEPPPQTAVDYCIAE